MITKEDPRPRRINMKLTFHPFWHKWRLCDQRGFPKSRLGVSGNGRWERNMYKVYNPSLILQVYEEYAV